MVTDNQVRMLMRLVNQEKLLKTGAAKAGMSEKTARKYRKSGKLPNQCQVIHDWRTRPDPLDPDDWRVGPRRCSRTTMVSRPKRCSKCSSENIPASTKMGNYAHFSGE